MELARPRFKKYLFVCENRRDNGAACSDAGSRIRELLKRSVEEKGLSALIRVSRSGCLDVCAEGPNVLLVPEYLWFKHVTEADVERIVGRAGEGIA